MDEVSYNTDSITMYNNVMIYSKVKVLYKFSQVYPKDSPENDER